MSVRCSAPRNKDLEAFLLNTEIETDLRFWDVQQQDLPDVVRCINGTLYFGGGSATVTGASRQTVLTKPGHVYNVSFTSNIAGSGGASSLTINVYDSATHALLATSTVAANNFGVTPNFTTLGPIVIEAKDASTGNMVSQDVYTQYIRLNEV